MSDWQAGDIALCINAKPFRGPTNLVAGRPYTVEAVGQVANGGMGLLLRGVPIRKTDTSRGFKIASRFVKITPGHKITGSEVDQKQPWGVGV